MSANWIDHHGTAISVFIGPVDRPIHLKVNRFQIAWRIGRAQKAYWDMELSTCIVFSLISDIRTKVTNPTEFMKKRRKDKARKKLSVCCLFISSALVKLSSITSIPLPWKTNKKSSWLIFTFSENTCSDFGYCKDTHNIILSCTLKDPNSPLLPSL